MERQNCFRGPEDSVENILGVKKFRDSEAGRKSDVPSGKNNVPADKSTSHLILAELRVQTMLLRNIDNNTKENNQILRSLRGDDQENLPMDDAVFQGVDGPFHLSSLCAINPNTFARDFLRKTYTKENLSKKILCPKGRSLREPFSEEETDKLRSALRCWFGENYNWCLVTASVNQSIRDLKLLRRSAD